MPKPNSPTDHGARPYFLTHEGARIFTAWTAAFIKTYEGRHGRHNLNANTPKLFAKGIGPLVGRMSDLTPGLYDRYLRPHADDIMAYTSAGSRHKDPKQAINGLMWDTVEFAARAPLVVAGETYVNNAQLRAQPMGRVVERMLREPGFTGGVNTLAGAGFDVLGPTGFRYGEAFPDFGRQLRRGIMKAGSGELMQVKGKPGNESYAIAGWAKTWISRQTAEVNRKWPNVSGGNVPTAGPMAAMESPITAGCPVRGEPIVRWCGFLANQLVYKP